MPTSGKSFPVSWDQFHRDARALAWRLADKGPFEAIVCITRGGLVPAAIVARELDLRLVETVCVASHHDYKTQGELKVLKSIAPSVLAIGNGRGKGVLLIDDLTDTGKTARIVRDMLPDAHFRDGLCQAGGCPHVPYLHNRGVAGHLDLFSLGPRSQVCGADPRRHASGGREWQVMGEGIAS